MLNQHLRPKWPSYSLNSINQTQNNVGLSNTSPRHYMPCIWQRWTIYKRWKGTCTNNMAPYCNISLWTSLNYLQFNEGQLDGKSEWLWQPFSRPRVAASHAKCQLAVISTRARTKRMTHCITSRYDSRVVIASVVIPKKPTSPQVKLLKNHQQIQLLI